MQHRIDETTLTELSLQNFNLHFQFTVYGTTQQIRMKHEPGKSFWRRENYRSTIQNYEVHWMGHPDFC